MNDLHEKFLASLKEGDVGEDIVIRYLVEVVGMKFLNSNKDKKYDSRFEFKSKIWLCEVKTDKKGTQNHFVEFKYNGKDSGIETTEAHFYAFYYTDLKQIWFIPTKRLKKIIKEEKYERTTEKSGDKNENCIGTCGYLFNREKTKEYFKMIQL